MTNFSFLRIQFALWSVCAVQQQQNALFIAMFCNRQCVVAVLCFDCTNWRREIFTRKSVFGFFVWATLETHKSYQIAVDFSGVCNRELESFLCNVTPTMFKCILRTFHRNFLNASIKRHKHFERNRCCSDDWKSDSGGERERKKTATSTPTGKWNFILFTFSFLHFIWKIISLVDASLCAEASSMTQSLNSLHNCKLRLWKRQCASANTKEFSKREREKKRATRKKKKRGKKYKTKTDFCHRRLHLEFP